MALKHKNAIGIFPDRQSIESAIAQLSETEFPMNKVSVVVEHLNSEDPTIGRLIEPVVQSEKQFTRDRLLCNVLIRPDEAVLGAEINVPTPDGIVTMKVPKGLQTAQSLRLRGKGWTLPKGGRGDLFAKLQIVTPQELNAIEQECYEKILANTTFNPRAHLEAIKVDLKL